MEGLIGIVGFLISIVALILWLIAFFALLSIKRSSGVIEEIERVKFKWGLLERDLASDDHLKLLQQNGVFSSADVDQLKALRREP